MMNQREQDILFELLSDMALTIRTYGRFSDYPYFGERAREDSLLMKQTALKMFHMVVDAYLKILNYE